ALSCLWSSERITRAVAIITASNAIGARYRQRLLAAIAGTIILAVSLEIGRLSAVEKWWQRASRGERPERFAQPRRLVASRCRRVAPGSLVRGHDPARNRGQRSRRTRSERLAQ